MLKKIIIILFVFISSSLNCFAADYQAVNKNYLQIIKQAQVYEAQGSIYKANQSYQEAEHIFRADLSLLLDWPKLMVG